jgi:hypothetical protein
MVVAVAVVLAEELVEMASLTTITVVMILTVGFTVAVLVVLVLLGMAEAMVQQVVFELFGDQTVSTQQQIPKTLHRQVKE